MTPKFTTGDVLEPLTSETTLGNTAGRVLVGGLDLDGAAPRYALTDDAGDETLRPADWVDARARKVDVRWVRFELGRGSDESEVRHYPADTPDKEIERDYQAWVAEYAEGWSTISASEAAGMRYDDD